MNQVYSELKQCYGCSACENICPKAAINMTADAEGFLYPEIDTIKCINCGMCQKVCPHINDTPNEPFEQHYFAVQHNDKEIVAASSSGGMFTALSDAVLEQGGAVYGACFNEAFAVTHMRTTDHLSRNQLRGSKYVQSNMNSVMKQIVLDIQNNIPVMFIGTPCQVAGVKNYVLEKKHSLDKLLLCDFICHGTASPKVWNSYINFFKQKYSTGLQQYEFRGKTHGWNQSQPILRADNRDISAEYEKRNSFRLMYQTCLLNRPSCYFCKYTSYQRPSDITIADFWNIKKIAPSMDDNTGTSQVLINTSKGAKWFDACKNNIRFIECNKEAVWQPHLEYPNACPSKRDKFWRLYNTQDFSRILSLYGQGDFLTKCKNSFTPILKKMGLYVLAGKIYKLLFVQQGNNQNDN